MKPIVSRSRTSLRVAISGAALVTAMALSAAGHAQSVINPGFETGDSTGWTMNGGTWNGVNWPPLPSDYPGPATEASIQTTGGVDPFTGTPTVFAGNYSMRLNDLVNDYSITAMAQTINGYSGSKLYYAWNAVLEPSHGATDSPSFIIKVVDKTTNTVINNVSYSAFTAQNTTVFRNVGQYVTSDWKVEEIDMISGHDYDMIFVALDCPYGGHRGYVYVDGFGNAIPVANAGVDFDPLTDITRGASILIPIGGSIPDIDLAKPFYTDSELAANLVNPKFVGGTLQADSATAVGSTFTVDTLGGTIDTNGFDVTYSGGFAGVGSMTKTGAGIATLNSFASTINGSFTVNQGTLMVNDALSALAVNVNSGATLAGSGGIVADVNVAGGGTLAPGSNIGTLSVIAGDVVLSDGSTFATDLDGRAYAVAGGAGTYDRLLLMTGSTFAANGTIAPKLRGITGGNNTFNPIVGDTFTVVTGGTVTGAFDAVAQPASGLPANTRFDVLYGATTVRLALTPGNFATWGTAHGWKVNAVSAAAGLQPFRPAAGARTGAFYPLFSSLYGMNSDDLGFAFSQISGEVHADALQMAQNSARDVSQIGLNAAMEPWGCSPKVQTMGSFTQPTPEVKDVGCGPESTKAGPTIWGRYIGQSTEADEDNIAYGYRPRADGVLAGVNLVNNGTTRLGIGGGFSDGDLKSDVGSSADINTTSLFGYGAHSFGGLSLGATVGWNKASVKSDRNVNLTSGSQLSTAKYKIETITGALEARYDIKLSARSVLRPVAGIEIARSTADGFSETGPAVVALTMPKEKWTSARTKLGAELAVGVGNPVEAGVFGNWRHELKDPTATRIADLGAASWVVSSVDADKDAFEAGAMLGIKASNAIKVRFDYAIVRSGEYHTDRATAGVSIKF